MEVTPLLISNQLSWGEMNPEAETLEFNDGVDNPPPLSLAVALVKRNIVPIEENNTEDQSSVNSEESNGGNLPDNSANSEINGESEVATSENQLPQPPQIQKPQTKSSGITSGNKTITQQRMVLIGNSNFATDGWFSQQLNSDFVLNSIAWLTYENDNNLSIRPKQATNRRLNVTPRQVTLVSWLALLIIPALSLIAAITTWWQRSK